MAKTFLDPDGVAYFWSKVKERIPTKVSDITNDSGFITTETDPTVPSWAKASSKPSYTASEVGAVPTSRTVNGKALSSNITLSASDVGALSSSTTIPTKTSDLTNDSGFITQSDLVQFYSGTSTPASSLGEDGDVYFQTD